MSISIGKTPRYEVSDIALTIYTNASNLLKLNTNQTRNDIQFRNFKLGQHITDPTALQLYQSNILLTQSSSNQLLFFQNAQYQSNITILKNLTIQSNLTALNFETSNLQIQYLSGSPFRIYDSNQNIFLDLNSGGDLRYMGNIGIGKTQPMYALDVINSVYVHSNLYGGDTRTLDDTRTSNVYVNEIRAIQNSTNSVIFGTNTLQWNANEVIINNPTLIGTVSYSGTISLQQSIISTLESCNLRVINKSLNNYGVYIKQLNPSFGLTSNHNALHIDSYFPTVSRTIPIFVVDSLGRISSGRYSSNLPNQDAFFSYYLDDKRFGYLSGFMNLYTCNAYEQTIIDKRGHIGIGTSSTKHFLQITNPYTSYENYYQRQPSLIGLYQTTSNIKPYMLLYNCNEAICFNINSNGNLLFQADKLYDQRYHLEVTSNAYIKYLHIDQFESSTGVVNFTESYLSNINQLKTNRISVNTSGSLSNITITGLTVEDMNIGAFDYIPSTEFEEFRISTTRLLYIGSNFVMNPNRLFFEVEQSNLPNDKIRIYANGNTTEEVNVIHTIAKNRTSTFNITNCNTAPNSISQIQFDANRNIYQFGIVNGEGYITCNVDVTDRNRELTFTDDGTRIGTKIHLLKDGTVTLNQNDPGTHILTINGNMEVISQTTGASNFIITSQGNIGFGTNQPRSFVDINKSSTLLSGNLGIGILTPTERLHISGTLNAKRVLGVKYTDLRGGAFNQWRLVDGGIYFRELSCNVGIGTANPTASLHVYTSNYRTPSFVSYMTNVPLPTMEYNPLCNQLKISGGMVVGYDSTSNQYRAPKDSLIVDGSIGIGTTYPIKKLHIQTDAKFAGSTSNDKNVYIGTNYDIYISTKLTGGTVSVRSGNYEAIQSSLTEGFSNIAYYPPTGMVRNSAITADGSVIEWDDMSVDGQGLLEGLNNIVLASVGYYHGIVINTNGTNTDNVTPYYTQITVPIGLSNLIKTSQQVHKFEFSSDEIYSGGSLYLNNLYGDFTICPSVIENRIYSRETQKSELLIFKGSESFSSTFDTYIWTSVCWVAELSIYVAVGWNGVIAKSENGINWTITVRNNSNEYWTSVVWSPEKSLFIIIGWNSYVLTSSDGTTWTPQTIPYNIWNSICWSPEKSLFVAVGWGRILTSSDGTTWTSIYAPVDNIWQSICWSGSIFVAVAYAGANNRVMTSPNGSTWTTKTTPMNSWQSVCWSPQLYKFVAVASSGTNNRVMTGSSDGNTWITGTSAIDNDWFSVVWSPQLSLFVAVAYSYTGSANKVMTSINGIEWSASSDVNTSKWRSICWSPQQQAFVAVAGQGTYRTMRSANSTQWDTYLLDVKQTIRMRAGQIALDVYPNATTNRSTENIQGYITNTGISGFSNIKANILQTNTISDISGIPIIQRNIYDTPGPFTIPKPTTLKYSYARIQIWGAGGGGGGANYQGTTNNNIGTTISGGGGGGGGAYGEIIIPWHIAANSIFTANIGYGGIGGLGGYIASSTVISAVTTSSGANGRAATNGVNGTSTIFSLSNISGNSILTANWYANGGTGGTTAGLDGTGGTVLGTYDISQSGTTGGIGGNNNTPPGGNGINLTASGFAASGGGGGGACPQSISPETTASYDGGNSGSGCIPAAYLSGTAAKAFGEITDGSGIILISNQTGYSINDTYGGGTGGGGSASLTAKISDRVASANIGKDGGWPGGGGGGGGAAKQIFPNLGYSGYGASVTAGYGGNGGNGAIIITYY